VCWDGLEAEPDSWDDDGTGEGLSRLLEWNGVTASPDNESGSQQ